ncbi:MAG: hypothetical protein HOZ81_45080 [Streptomyces sp.]|nr:hypothetical protein [Streptomyces sp.]NUS28250.1 hypothetical protein [Streptomyces sp.]
MHQDAVAQKLAKEPKPVTDHGDFVNVFDEQLMNQKVECINAGQECR